MNKSRRKQIALASSKISLAVDNLKGAKDILEKTAEEEQEALDNRPESFCETDSYQESEEAVNILEDSASDLEQIIDNLSNI